MMEGRHGLSEDKPWLVLQFLRLSPTERMRYATGFVDSALRVNPGLLKHRSTLGVQERTKRWRVRRVVSRRKRLREESVKSAAPTRQRDKIESAGK